MANLPEPDPRQAAWIALLQAVRERVGQPDNDFGWTPWTDTAAAQAGIDRLLRPLLLGRSPDRGELALLFAPTGALLELALSSGWAEDAVRMAAQADRLLATWPVGHGDGEP